MGGWGILGIAGVGVGVGIGGELLRGFFVLGSGGGITTTTDFRRTLSEWTSERGGRQPVRVEARSNAPA